MSETEITLEEAERCFEKGCAADQDGRNRDAVNLFRKAAQAGYVPGAVFFGAHVR